MTFTATVSPAAGKRNPHRHGDLHRGASRTGCARCCRHGDVHHVALPVGTTTITAAYSGDAIFLPSSGTVDQVVNQGTTSVLVSTSGSPSVNGDPVTFTATVSVVGGFGSPTGTVTFFDGATSLGVQPFAAVTTLSTSALAIGDHSITAVYSGDTNFAGATSPMLTQTVIQGSHLDERDSASEPVDLWQRCGLHGNRHETQRGRHPGWHCRVLRQWHEPRLECAGRGRHRHPDGSRSSVSVITQSPLSTAATPAFTSSTGATSLIIDQGTTAVVRDRATATRRSIGTAVTFTATVQVVTGSGTPTGVVAFFADGLLIGSSSLSGASASVSTSSLGGGSHPITVIYFGDTNFAGSTGALAQVVNPGTTSVGLTTTGSPSVEGDAVTFTATVTVLTGTGTPTGTVQFRDGANNLGAAQPLSSNSASLTVSTLLFGSHSITAVYSSGDANFTGSTSGVVTQLVLRRTSTVVTSNRNPAANLGQNITFTATVRPVLGTGFPTTGTVQFSIDAGTPGAVTSGPLALNVQGRATFQIATLSAGNHQVIATYGGTTVFAGSVSVPIVQVVNQVATTTTVTSNTNPSVFGQSVTLTARVQPNPGAAGTMVQFWEGTTSLGSFPLDATGRARLPISTLSVGIHGVTAVFPGTVNYMPSTSAAFNQTVNKANTRTVVTTSGTPAPRNTLVTFTATVTPTGSGVGVPTGNVQFRDNGVNMGSQVGLNTSGQAAFPTSTLSVGLHQISAVYIGDAGFNTSTSANRSQRIL